MSFCTNLHSKDFDRAYAVWALFFLFSILLQNYIFYYNIYYNILFDFIPFAFTDGREAFFINDNCLLENLIRTNRNLKRRVDNEMAVSEGKAKDVRRILFKTIQETADFIDYDVEVIVKYREKEFFETLYIRRESIKILKALNVYEPFCFSVKLGESYWLNVQKEVISCILNLTRTDYLISFLVAFVVFLLIFL